MAVPTVHIIGAGVAGLSAGLELLERGLAKPVIIEEAPDCGGLVRYFPHGTGQVDVGGHRFHTRSARVEKLWLSVMPLADDGLKRKLRHSQLYFDQQFYPYPLAIDLPNLRRLGFARGARAGISYLLRRRGEVQSLRDFFRATYGAHLSELFFESYTEKVWGRPAQEIAASWAPERLKFPGPAAPKPQHFYYPHGGPARFWEKVRERILRAGGEIRTGEKLLALGSSAGRVTELHTSSQRGPVSQLFSTIPLAQLAGLLTGTEVWRLPHRGLVSVHLSFPQHALGLAPANTPQWIYVHGAGRRAARIQNYRAWDPSLVGEEGEILGVEFFADPGEELWEKSDEQLALLALAELRALGLVSARLPPDRSTVVRLPYAYPCHWKEQASLAELQRIVDGFQNVYSFGRQGLHRYLNMDLTTLSALRAVGLYESGEDKRKLWDDFPGLHNPE